MPYIIQIFERSSNYNQKKNVTNDISFKSFFINCNYSIHYVFILIKKIKNNYFRKFECFFSFEIDLMTGFVV